MCHFEHGIKYINEIDLDNFTVNVFKGPFFLEFVEWMDVSWV